MSKSTRTNRKKRKKRNKRSPPVDVQITKEALQIDLADMTGQATQLFTQANTVQGAVIYCARLIAVMEGKAPMTEPRPGMLSKEDVDRLAAEAKAADTAARKAQTKKAAPKKKPAPSKDVANE